MPLHNFSPLIWNLIQFDYYPRFTCNWQLGTAFNNGPLDTMNMYRLYRPLVEPPPVVGRFSVPMSRRPSHATSIMCPLEWPRPHMLRSATSLILTLQVWLLGVVIIYIYIIIYLYIYIHFSFLYVFVLFCSLCTVNDVAMVMIDHNSWHVLFCNGSLVDHLS